MKKTAKKKIQLSEEKAKQLIIRSVIKMRKQGWKITTHAWLNRKEKTCCPLAACIIARDPKAPVTKGDSTRNAILRRIFGWSRKAVEQFTSGFDSGSSYDGTEMSQLGVAIRRQLLI